MIQEEPEKFKELCEKVGLALMMGQKLQFALAHYYSVFHMVHSKWSKEKAKEKISFHLSKPMGVIVSSIEKDSPSKPELFEEIIEFKKQRNWLAHDFDEESTPFLTQGERFDYYIQKMEKITIHANEIMLKLDQIGEALIPVRGWAVSSSCNITKNIHA
ncbi:MAG: hypothetical protein PF690_05855 [Deltaproteobacteria bacterium]|jgi:hypothetical protein|nr:hypothetical protein [Deltaproteobacteria bacterium]